jgi:hypothetical protein
VRVGNCEFNTIHFFRAHLLYSLKFNAILSHKVLCNKLVSNFFRCNKIARKMHNIKIVRRLSVNIICGEEKESPRRYPPCSAPNTLTLLECRLRAVPCYAPNKHMAYVSRPRNLIRPGVYMYLLCYYLCIYRVFQEE